MRFEYGIYEIYVHTVDVNVTRNDLLDRNEPKG